MKPPRKVPRIEPDSPARNTPTEEGTVPRRPLPGIGTSESNTDPSGIRQPEGDAGNTPPEAQIRVVDIPTPASPAISSAGITSDIHFLPAAVLSSLSPPFVNGLRYGKRNTMYAEIENEGITLVRRREDGEYQASSANALIATGPLLERIAGTSLWRRKNTDLTDEIPRAADSQPATVPDEQPGPSSRTRQDDETSHPGEEHSLLSDLLTQPTSPLDLSSALWRNWGSSTQPQSVQSVEINGLHYRIVPHGSLEHAKLVFLEHPRFSPSRFEAYEQMLQSDIELQPRWAVKKNGQWEVPHNSLPFERSFSAYVAETFKDLADNSLNSVARELFNRANHSDVIDSMGLLVLKQTFRHWATPNDTPTPRRELADPLLMLSAIRRSTGTGWLDLPSPDAAGPLLRLDFAPHHFPAQWSEFSANPSGFNVKRLLASVLVRNGYDVFPLTSEYRGPTLVFTRANHDSVFFLKLGRIDGDTLRDVTPPGNELADPHLAARVGERAQIALRAAHDQNKVIWLLGGTQTTTSGWQSVFIIRER